LPFCFGQLRHLASLFGEALAAPLAYRAPRRVFLKKSNARVKKPGATTLLIVEEEVLREKGNGGTSTTSLSVMLTAGACAPEISPRRRARQRGSQVVEVALCLLPFLAILFLLIDLCLVIFLKATFQHAVREGVRFAMTGRTFEGLGHDASIKRVVQQYAIGFLGGEQGAEKIKIRYFVPGTLTETSSNAGGNIVEISIEGFSWRPMVPLFKSPDPVMISARSTGIMEPSPGGVPPPR
jgi:hypothetical protein